jgi:glycosyltransferase involved in cell wall biosynthesis
VFFAWAAWCTVRIDRPDLAITLTTPPGLSILGAVMKKLRGARHFIWEMDLYPEVLADLRYFRADSWMLRFLGAILDYPRRRANGIIALGDCMRNRLLRRGIPSDRVHVSENWADARHIKVLPFAGDRPLTVLYSGNLGLAHDTETIETAIEVLKSTDGIRFVFAGGGPSRPRLERFCAEREIKTAVFRPYVGRDELSDRLAEGDIGLVTQKEGSAGTIVPSKVYGIMAAGRPVLFIGPAEATPARIIERFQCGWHLECGEGDRLAGLLRHLAANPHLVRHAGERARKGFEQEYDVPIGVARIASILGLAPQECAGSAAPGGVTAAA